MNTLIKTLLGGPFFRSAFVLLAFALACFAPMPLAQAVVPPPDGGYPGFNTAEGDEALFGLTTGALNTAIGFGALTSLTIGNGNTAIGYFALGNSTTGGANTATGYLALLANTTGVHNTATGLQALEHNTTGSTNTATGFDALRSNNIGSNNTALGFQAGANLTTGSNNIDIGNVGVAAESNTIRIGTVGTQTATYMAGIMGKTVPLSTPVFINASGKLGTTPSSARFKDAIKPMDKASEAILSLKPVSFHYKKELDPEGIPQFGLVAEDVAKVNPDLVVRDPDRKPYTVRYDAVNAMLLNEFLKEHRKVEGQARKAQEQEATIARLRSTVTKQEVTIADLRSTIAQQQKRMEAVTARLNNQEAQIQKVSAQLELRKPSPQTAANVRDNGD